MNKEKNSKFCQIFLKPYEQKQQLPKVLVHLKIQHQLFLTHIFNLLNIKNSLL